MPRLFHINQKRKRNKRFRCGRKWGYPNSRNAHLMVELLRQRTGDTSQIDVWHCDQCKGFHIGHAEPRPKRA